LFLEYARLININKVEEFEHIYNTLWTGLELRIVKCRTTLVCKFTLSYYTWAINNEKSGDGDVAKVVP
jgi:hypothetical protein